MKKNKTIIIAFCLMFFMQFAFSQTVIDVDSNSYKTVQIGNQIWMAENLKTTKYNDKKPIPNIKQDSLWSSTTKGAMCYYNNDFDYGKIYGALYNWYSVDTKKLCPVGWHVPSDTEWKELEMYLGLSQEEAEIANVRGFGIGGKLKATSHWNSPNIGAVNYFNFSALPAGLRNYYTGEFQLIGAATSWWANNENYNPKPSERHAWSRYLYYNHSSISRVCNNKAEGYSVRCLKN